jgi:aldehyde:ferredoxin oxidoreductase
MLGAYAGKLLRIDLSAGTIVDEPLPSDDILRKYIGGLGLGARIIYDEVPLDVGALDPENRLVIMTGPLTGTTVPSASDWTVTSIRHELDSKAIQGSHSHGFWGAFLKKNGIDGIIFQGASEKPVYLSILDGKAELRDASRFWGLDTHDTEDAVKTDLGVDVDDSSVAVATIGPAGENLVSSASIQNEKHHAASKGMGCIMGAKKLKAIAVNRGPQKVNLAQPKEFLQVAKTWREAVVPTHVRAHAVLGTPPGTDGPYFTAGKNLTDPEWARQARIDGVIEAKNWNIEVKGCWACPSPCSYAAEVTTGPHAGYRATLAGGYENSEGAAIMAGVEEPGTVMYLTDVVDRLGADSGSIGAAIGVAFEAYEAGILTKEMTGGLELHWGDAEATEKLCRTAANQEGFGRILADGPKKTAEYIGGDALNMPIHAKGAGINLHDWRANPSLIVGQMTTPAGPCWQGTLGVEMFPEPDLGLDSRMDPWNQEGKGQVLAGQQMRAAFEDCNGVCWFAANLSARAMPGYYTWLAQTISYATGWEDFTPQEMLEVGERVMNLQKAYAIRRGLTKADDLDVGPRLVEPHETGVTKGLDIRNHLEYMVEDFYTGMDWDRETGKPLPATLRKLGLEELVPDLYPEGEPSPA